MTGRVRGVAVFLAVLWAAALPVLAQGTVLVEYGSPMVYLPNTSDPGIGLAWTERVYPNAWTAGTYGVGYGAGALIQTTVAGGTLSVYTRAEFEIADVSAVQNLFAGIDYDDGAILWINGVEVYRTPEMPDAATLPVPAWNTTPGQHESSNNAPPDYGPLLDVSAAIGSLVNGTNVLAVGVWNVGTGSSDLAAAPRLVMNVQVVRGPYLQWGTPDSVVVRWNTAETTDSRVRYGPAPGSLTSQVNDAAAVQEHEVQLTGLSADTVYYYSVGSTTEVMAGDDADTFFRTAPPVGTRRPIRVWAIGDSGTADANARAVYDAYENLQPPTHTDLWLMLGDNAYNTGLEAEYQAAVFDTYPELLRRSVLWPTIGNHDAASSNSVSLTGPYYEIFTLPDTGPGVSSGTEAYYSFDFGNLHFVSLNSQELSLAGDMLTWLEADLMDTAQDWIVAFWHHPPYTKGSHDSDNPSDSGGRMEDMRVNALPILEAAGVDLVLTGHSHSYERSFLLDGHYGTSSEIVSNPSLKLDPGDGRVDGDGAYQKATAGPAAHEGAVYIVAGSSGKISGGSLDHPAMYLSLNELGSVVLDVEGDRMRIRFLDDQGTVRDYLTLVKDTATPPVADFEASPTSGTAPLAVAFTDRSTTNTASWSWDLDGDTSPDSAVQNPGHVYVSPGVYTVSLVATNHAGSHQVTKTDYLCVSGGVPDGVTGLMVAADDTTFTWDPPATFDHYDVVRGDLAALAASAGDFAAALTACIENDGTDEQAADPALPASGQGFFYLVRAASLCDEPGTYDSGGPGQVGLRDGEVQAAAATCP